MRQGILMVEIVVALAVVGIVLVGLVALVNRGVSNAGFARNRTEAGGYSREGMEWVKSEKTSDWTSFYGHITTGANCIDTTYKCYCINNLDWTSPASENGCPGVGMAGYSRVAKFKVLSNTPPQKVEVIVSVSWALGGKNYAANITNQLVNY